MAAAELTHVDGAGKASMVNVSAKPVQRRTAKAAGRILLAQETLNRIRENTVQKGDVLTVARVAGIQAAKRTGELIPLCHPLGIDHVTVDVILTEVGVAVESQVVCTGRTGVEMEALTAVSVALLTVYDMCKAIDKEMVIEEVRLLDKRKETIDER